MAFWVTWQYALSVKVKEGSGSKVGMVVYHGGGEEKVVLAGWVEVCFLSNRGFLK